MTEQDFAKIVVKWIRNDLLRLLKREHVDIKDIKITPEQISRLLIITYEDKIITTQFAKIVFEEMFMTGKNPEEIILEKYGLVFY